MLDCPVYPAAKQFCKCQHLAVDVSHVACSVMQLSECEQVILILWENCNLVRKLCKLVQFNARSIWPPHRVADCLVLQADLQAELQALYQMPKSRAVEEQKAAIRRELQALQ